MQDQTPPPPAMRALRATYDQARGSREAAEALRPLLSLLDPTQLGEGSALDEVTELLSTIVQTQLETLRAIEVLSDRLDERS
ncbi:hypothetical protein GRZ55_10940 [Chelativorans sp. ZYF759]|uniref:hypothetical protein n=1 Tax=Chelativorans sp. ZYF759 TaxID=2692213 RepID=UPI00145F6ADB|nr:hypothetical protein [Chelativorans sp. ZYF759]NMG39758.1 hypothetical protein [Chelativorans sp. ZYF759]